MKVVESARVFQPITLVIETAFEAKVLASLLAKSTSEVQNQFENYFDLDDEAMSGFGNQLDYKMYKVMHQELVRQGIENKN